MLVERRRTALPFEFLARVTIAWAFVAGVLVTANWDAVSGPQVLVPLVTLGSAMLLAARIAWRLMGDEETTLAALIPALSIPVLFEFAQMRVDNHEWQIICGLVVVNALLSRRSAIGGWVIGLSCAVWSAISLEGLVFTTAITGVLALRWLRDRDARSWLVGCAQALAVVSPVLLMVTTGGLGVTTIACGALSLAHCAGFAWAAVALTILGRLEPLPAGMRVVGIAIAAIGAVGFVLFIAPQCASGGWNPIWRANFSAILQFTVAPIIGVIAAANLANASRDWLRRYWGDYALILTAAFAFSMLYTPAAAVACVLAAPPLAWQVREWLRRIRLIKPFAPRLVATLAVALALLPALPIILVANIVPA